MTKPDNSCGSSVFSELGHKIIANLYTSGVNSAAAQLVKESLLIFAS